MPWVFSSVSHSAGMQQNLLIAWGEPGTLVVYFPHSMGDFSL